MSGTLVRGLGRRARGALGKLYGAIDAATGRRLCRWTLLLPGSLHSVGDGNYREIGSEFFGHFRKLAGLSPTDRVLDIGCGTGRMARPLTRFLTSGGYDGIDIVAPSIRWCQHAYARFRNFHFHFSDVHNSAYNPQGKIRARDYRFPFESGSFDLVILTSVFTHMLPDDLEQYVSEISRVLKPGGRCLITYFLLNSESRRWVAERASPLSFAHELAGCRVERVDIPEAVVGYDEQAVKDAYRRHGLTIAGPVHYGGWSGRKDGVSFQDIVVARKAAVAAQTQGVASPNWREAAAQRSSVAAGTSGKA